MWVTKLCMIFLGFCCGAAVAGGVFALIASLGLLPRLAGKTSLAAHFIPLENAVIYGGIAGSVIQIFPHIPLRFGIWFSVLYGLSAGMFTGCLAAALAEVLNVFPVLFRRANVKQGLSWMVFFFALGKTMGALYYFLRIHP